MEANASPAEPSPNRLEDLSRTTALTDGVIAFAITLLVLDIAVPEIRDALVSDELGSALWELRPQVFGFVLSFVVVGYYWMTQRLVFSNLRTIDVPMMLINLFFLLMIAFMPFVASLLAEYVPDGLAVACYAGVMALAGFSQLLMVVYPGKKGQFQVTVRPSDVRLVTKKIAVAPIIYLVVIPVAFLNGWVALGLLVLIPIARVIMYRRNG
jgi:uncharacterized membrane protein